VEGLGEDPCGGGLAGAAGPREEVRVADASFDYLGADRVGDVPLPDDVGEPLGSVAAVEGDFGHTGDGSSLPPDSRCLVGNPAFSEVFPSDVVDGFVSAGT